MTSLIKSANLFPYGNLWRIGGDTEISHYCGGVTSLLLVTLLLVVSIVKVAEVLKMETVFASSTTIQSLVPPFIEITTKQDHPSLRPFMFAFALNIGFSQTAGIASSDIKVTMAEFTEQRGSVTRRILGSQPCTVGHFLSVANVEAEFSKWGLDRYTCLSINGSYSIGGNRGLSPLYRSLQATFQCNSAACLNAVDANVIFSVVVLDTEVSPTNATHPMVSYTTSFDMAFSSKTFAQYSLSLEQSKVSTDRSVLPFSQVSSQTSTRSQPFTNPIVTSNSVPKTTVHIRNSGSSHFISRRFLQLLDAVAFAGGIFQILLGIFFFMGSFGRIVYETQFLQHYFRTKMASGFITYLKQNTYVLMSAFTKPPDWKETEQSLARQRTANRLLDVVYLQRRIEFLQKAVSVLLEKHHWKGLLLLQSLTFKEADAHYEEHQFRSKLLRYLARRSEAPPNTASIHIQKKPLQAPGASQNNTKSHLSEQREMRTQKVGGRGISKGLGLGQHRPETSHQLNMGEELATGEWSEGGEEGGGSAVEEAIVVEVITDVRRLLEEGDAGEERSRRICQMGDSRLWRSLRRMILEQQANGYYFITPPLAHQIDELKH